MRRGPVECLPKLDLDNPHPRAGEQLVPLGRRRALLNPSRQLAQLHYSFVLWKHLFPKLVVRPKNPGG